MPLLRVQLGPQAAEVLCILALFVALAGGLLALAFLVVETSAVELSVSLCFGVRLARLSVVLRDLGEEESELRTDVLVLGLD